jgi:hypothetical protein
MQAAQSSVARKAPAVEKYDPAYTDPEGRARAEELLRRYPDTTDEETAEILSFLKKGKFLEVGLVSGSDEFRDKVAELRKKHDQHFRLKPRELIVGLVVAMVPIGALVWNYAF